MMHGLSLPLVTSITHTQRISLRRGTLRFHLVLPLFEPHYSFIRFLKLSVYEYETFKTKIQKSAHYEQCLRRGEPMGYIIWPSASLRQGSLRYGEGLYCGEGALRCSEGARVCPDFLVFYFFAIFLQNPQKL